MLKSSMMAGVAGLTLLAASSALAGTLVPVTPFPGAATTIVFGINDDGVIAGSYRDSDGIEHGFFGPLNGTYTSFDYGGTSSGTEPRALNDDGAIVGFATDPNFAVGQEFLREADGTLKTFKKDGAPLDGIAQGIAKKEHSTGDYIDPNTFVRTGYLAKDGKYKSDLNLGFDVTRTSPRAIASNGAIAGFYDDDVGAMHGFIDNAGTVLVVDADDSGTTVLEGLNKKGLATGQIVDSGGAQHSFTYDSTTGKFKSIDVPDGSTFQQAWGVNNEGQVAVSTSVASYIYCTKKSDCPAGAIDIPEGKTWSGKPGSALHYDANGRTGAHPAKIVHPISGAAQ